MVKRKFDALLVVKHQKVSKYYETDFRFVLHIKSNNMFSLVLKKKHPEDKGDQISGPPFIRHRKVIFGSLATPRE